MKKINIRYTPKDSDSEIYDNILEYVKSSFEMEEKKKIH